MFCCKILRQIGDRVAFYLEDTCIKRNTARCLRPETKCVVNVIFVEAGSLDLFDGKIFCQLINDCADNLDVSQFI